MLEACFARRENLRLEDFWDSKKFGRGFDIESPPDFIGDQLQTKCVPRYAAFLGATWLLLLSRCATGQRVAQVEEHHVQVRVGGLSSDNKPRIAREVGILAHEVQGAILRVFPYGL